MPNHTQPKPVIIMPAFNEAKEIGSVLKKTVLFHLPVIVVDDGSADQTAVIARKYTPNVLSHPLNLGKGAALKTGCEYAFDYLDASAVIFLDSDNQHDPAEIKNFIKKINDGYDLVFGIRRLDRQMSLFRRLANQSTSYLIKLLYGQYLPDIPSGFKAMTRQGYAIVKWETSGYAVELEIAVRTVMNHLPFTTIPINTIYHTYDRGMTPLDALLSGLKIISWKLGL